MGQQTKHTPGPWQVIKTDNQISVTTETWARQIATISNEECNAETNAQLIAEAPTTAAERDSLKMLLGEWDVVNNYILAQSFEKFPGESFSEKTLNAIQERDKLKEEVKQIADICHWQASELSKLKEENERLKNEVKELTIIIKASVPKRTKEILDINKSLVETLKSLCDQVAADCSIGSDPKYLSLFQKWQNAMQEISKAKAINP